MIPRIHSKGSTAYWSLVGNGLECGNGMIIDSYCGSFPFSLLSTSKTAVLLVILGSLEVSNWSVQDWRPPPRVERDLQGGSCFQLVELQLLQIHKIHPKLWIFKVFRQFSTFSAGCKP